jgi:hypothetical protein
VAAVVAVLVLLVVMVEQPTVVVEFLAALVVLVLQIQLLEHLHFIAAAVVATDKLVGLLVQAVAVQVEETTNWVVMELQTLVAAEAAAETLQVVTVVQA